VRDPRTAIVVTNGNGRRANYAKPFSVTDLSPTERATLSARLWGLYGAAVPRAGAIRRCWLAKTRSEPRFQLDATRGMLAARLVYSLYVGDVPEDHHVKRTCGQIRCLRPDHLALVLIGSTHRCPRCVLERRALAAS
jgi:hypothetical protein